MSKVQTNKSSSFIGILSNLIKAAGPMDGRLRMSLILILLSSVFQGAAYTCFYPIFMNIGKGKPEQVWFYIWIALGFVVISAICRWIGQDYDYGGFSSQAQYDLRKRQGEKLREMPLEFLSNKRSGKWSAVISNNVDEVISYTITVSSLMMYGVITPISVGLMTFFFDWKIAIVILILFPVIIPLYRWRKPAYDRGMYYLNEVHSELNAESIEFIQGLPVLKASNGIERIVVRLNKSIDKVREVQIFGHGKGSTPNLIITSALEVGMLVSLGLGILFVLKADSNMMVMTALMIIVIRFSELISSFVPMTMIFSLMEAGYKQITAMLTAPVLEVKTPQTKPTSYGIEFKEVDFYYEDAQEKTLSNINLSIAPKSIVALVGPSGSGKTTLARMIMRYADCQKGSISIGGVDIANLSQNDLLSMLSVVFQEVYLFDDTIGNNIRMAKPTATQEEIIDAARRAQCHDFISQLPKGYDTPIGDMGNTLSGGERQRISIARALLKNSPIVILDEPTSSLDSLSELAVQRAIDELVKEKIVIIIAHRLSTVRGADKICVLEKGQIVEEGTHEALMIKQGKYCDLWEAEKQIEALF
ncbi:ABC transporter ATP-binding protein [Myroides odoratimimus]|uniref:ABC transporter ATP-binding protein n=1 Tax=Myroides odoratimimus TaxID=76832 RepID=UPI0025762E86|nr:ABC transporter ATP-binding protein [Myroides odoratimimus]MDM1517241.1 ABC transporter ATP-binding protein [Myroides odoratimimus]